MARSLIALTLLVALATSSVLAQPGHQGPSGHAGGGHGGTYTSPPVFRGGPRGNTGWGAFHHDTAPARLSPHRFGGTNLPRPNGWRGDIHAYDLPVWQRGGWRHVAHNGRLGWWWVVGPNWSFFDAPIYPYPDLYTPYNQPFGWWYWCDPYREYYPYVTSCPVPWESVMPRE